MESPLITEILGNSRRNIIKEALLRRFQEIPPEVIRTLNRIRSLSRLRQLLLKLLDCESMEDFAALLAR